MLREEHPSPNFDWGGVLCLWQASLRTIEIKCGFTT